MIRETKNQLRRPCQRTWLLALLLLLTFASGWAQSALNGKKVTMKLEKANVSRFMNEMKRQTGIDFVYDAEAVKKLPTVTVNVNNMDASRVLDNVMGKFGCTYTVKGNIISFAPKSEKRTKRYVTGTVTDANGEKLPGVLVRLKGTDCQTVTDGDGHYCLCIPTDNCSIEYTYLGMNPSSCQVHAGDSDVNRHVVLSSDNVLDELVVLCGDVMTKIPFNR